MSQDKTPTRRHSMRPDEHRHAVRGAAMSATKHTPGEWRPKRLATYAEPGWVVLWPDNGSTHMRRLDYLGNFTEADARLIASAPTVLTLLKQMVLLQAAGLQPTRALVSLAADAIAATEERES